MSFRFANHRSFRDEQHLNLTPVYAADEGVAGDSALPVAGIFGANASGKSNLLHALSFMRHYAVRSDKEVEPGLGRGTGLTREPFRLEEEALHAPSRYVADLVLKGARHNYGFTLGPDGVLEEWLYHYPKKKKRVVFERVGNHFEWGDRSSRRDLVPISEITAPEALFLSTAARFSRRDRPDVVDPLQDVYRWFFRMRGRHRPGLRRTFPSTAWMEDDTDRAVVVSLLQAADVGITDVKLVSSAYDFLYPTLRENVQLQLYALERAPEPADMNPGRQTPEAKIKQRLQLGHKGMSGDVYMELHEESMGTQQLLDLAIDISAVLRSGVAMTVDEIDASLHPMLTARLVGLFRNSATNPLGSQLIFTSHDATLLGALDGVDILDRDQIWFTEKDHVGSSALYPLSDFKPRKDENRQRRYINGTYGAIPDLSTELFERALLSRNDVA